MKLTAESTVLDDKKIGDSFATLQVEADGIRTEVGTKVGNNEVISRINQTAESVKIQANKIQIDGVITAINNDTTTTINGGKITTGTLNAGAVNASSGTFSTENMPATARNDTYITDIGADGIRVHDSHTSNNSIVINSSGMEVFKGGTGSANSVAFYGDSARVGKSSTGHVEIYGGSQGGGLQVYEASDSMLAHIGYGNGNAESGTAITPYFTFGTRKSGTAVGNYSVVEGYQNTATQPYAHAEGNGTTASGIASHAEGYGTVASDYDAHAEGNQTTASQLASHAEGSGTTASGIASHAEGMQTQATGGQSHAGGYHTIAQGDCQTAIGLYNVADDTSLFIVGNGSSSARANAFLVDADGNAYIKGNLYAGCNANSTGGKIFDVTPREWTPHLYDLGTLLRPLPTAQYIKLGKIVIAWFSANNPNLSGINTMMQIRNLPMSSVIAGQLYIGTMTGSGSTITTQIADGAWYPRPNIKSSQFGNPTGYVTFCLIGLA